MNTNTFFPQGTFLDPLTRDISLEWKLFLMNLQFNTVNVTSDSVLATSAFLAHTGPAKLYEAESQSILATQVYGG